MRKSKMIEENTDKKLNSKKEKNSIEGTLELPRRQSEDEAHLQSKSKFLLNTSKTEKIIIPIETQTIKITFPDSTLCDFFEVSAKIYIFVPLLK